MSVSNAVPLNPSTGLTLEAGVKPLAGAFTMSKPIVEKGYTSYSAPYFQYSLRLYDAGAAPKNIAFSLAIGGTKVDLDVSYSGWKSGVWNHIVGTYDGTAMRIFRDGLQVASKAQTGTLSNYPTPLTFACSQNRDKTPDYCFRGDLDDVAVYDHALTSGQVLTHYQSVRPAGAPSPTVAPAISGGLNQGQTLTVTTGTWTGSPAAYAYQWLRCGASGGACTEIAGATGASYITAASDSGKSVRARISASNAAGSARESSAATGSIVGAPVNTAPPIVSGTLTESWTLTMTNGTWAGGPTAYAYQWYRCDSAGLDCASIPSATFSSYSTTSADVGARLKGEASASNGAGSSSAGSAASGELTGLPPVSRPAPGQCGQMVPWNGQWISRIKWVCTGDFYHLAFENRQWTGGFEETIFECVPIVGYPYNSCGQNGNLYHGSGNWLSFRREIWAVFGPGSTVGHQNKMISPTGCGDGQPGSTLGQLPCFQRGFAASGFPQEQGKGDCGNQVHANDVGSCLGDPVNGASGGFRTSATDLSLPGIGASFSLSRTYNSEDARIGAFGLGWSYSYGASLQVRSNGEVAFIAEDGQTIVYAPGTGGQYTATGSLSTLSTVTGGFVLVRSDRVSYRFDSTGRLTSIVDRNGKGVTLAYGANGLTTVTDQSGRAATVTTNAAKLITSVALPDGRSVSYVYSDRRLVSVTDVRGSAVSYEYTTQGWLKKIVDQNSHTVVQSTYDSGGRIVSQTDALGKVTTFSWNPTAERLTTTDANGHVWTDEYSGNRLIARVDPLGNRTEHGYDAAFNLTTVKDPRSNTTTFTYDARGNLLTATAAAPLSHQITYSYDTSNNLLTETNGLSATTAYTYDTAGNLIQATGADPDGGGPQTAPVTGVTVDSATGRPAVITDPRSKATQLTYTGNGQLSTVTTPLGNVTAIGYDAAGRVANVVEPRGNAAGATPSDYRRAFTYDAAGDVLTATDPLGYVTTNTYDAIGNLAGTTDANGRLIAYAYDAANRLVTVTAPDSTVTSYTYDNVGNLATRTDAKGRVTQYGYDAADRLISVLEPTGASWSYTYDANGNVASVTDPNGNATPTSGDGTTTFAYDVLNRLIAIDYSDSTPDVTFAYDAAGRRTSMTDGAGTELSSYDALGQLTGVTRGGDSFGYQYDAVGNVTERSYPGVGSLTYTYDDDGRLAGVSRSGASTSYAYDSSGRLTTRTLPASNGYVETRVYDRSGRLVSLAHTKGGTSLLSETYVYDAVGNPTSATGTGGTTTYGYDNRDRLDDVCFAASCPGGSDPFIRYTYDAVGNQMTEARPSGTTSYSYDAGDRLTSLAGPAGTTSFSFDANGNQTAAGAVSYAYDLANRMSSSTAGGVTTTYGYDGDGTRLSASDGTSSMSYLWDSSFGLPQLALERDGAGTTVRSYAYGLGRISMADASGTSYFHADRLGSVRNLTSAGGATEWTYAYEPFGSVRSVVQNDPAAPVNVMRFAGEQLDATGLYHLRARQYNPIIRRFLSADPMTQTLHEPGVSSFVYVDGRPLVFVDPSGWGPAWPGPCTGGFTSKLGCYVAGTAREFVPTVKRGWDDPNCYASVVSYWAAGGSVAVGGWRFRLAARAKPQGLLAGVSHPGHVAMAAAGPGLLGTGTFLAFGLDQSSRCAR